MIFNRRLTGALAWGGLILILAVPSAEMLSAKVDTSAPTHRAPAKTDAIKTASVGKTGDVVKDFETGGAPLPDYISDVPPTAAAPGRVLPATGTITPAPAPKVTTARAAQPAATPPAGTQAAALPATTVQETPPLPMPAHMRPLPPAQPAQTAAVQPAFQPQPAPVTAPAPSPTPPAPAQTATAQPAPAEAPVVLDENEVLAREANAQPAIVPPADIPQPPTVGEDELQDWDSGSLADYLQRRGLMNDAANPAAQSDESSASFENDDGYFLNDRPRRVRRNSDDSFAIFSND